MARQGLALLAGIVWTLPNSALGLLAGLACMPWGARPEWRRREYALAFRRMPHAGAGGALTLGNVILYSCDTLDTPCFTYAHRAGLRSEPCISLADHERAHVFQYMALGPLFLPLYAACGGISARNRFEYAADRYAQRQRGWWPWAAA
ncbi:hypothetical protein SAMN04487785_11527 [Dyella jiangningensis]|uniref:hypothetical protein n=1 Tax=Dyella sp. AtDHG13 TaxID=1938897 RepID=UPI000880CA6B|nr:hypothetical protein [Dyella sp. AtDHG13]PXV58612.1 hypothetical protein BDW41_105121 [Dyella sp. AtDHG13]SDL13254.1 hypothetical protein SAMN04487785_11527 [Dyella jiangningensis]